MDRPAPSRSSRRRGRRLVRPGARAHVPGRVRRAGPPRAPRADGVHLTFDDGPHPEGTPAVLDVLARRGARGDVLPRRGAGPPRPRAGPRDADGRARRRPARRPPPVPAARDPARAGRRPRPRATRRIADRDRAAPRRSTGRRTGIPSPAGLALARRRGWATWLWSRWGRDWRADATPASSPGWRRAGLGAATSSSSTTPTTTARAARWRSTVGALPRDPRARRARGRAAAATRPPGGLGGPALRASRRGTRPSIVARRAASAGAAGVRVAERADDVGSQRGRARG